MRFGRLTHAAVLAVALLPAVAAAQPRPGSAGPPVRPAAPGAPGVELGVGSMVVAIFPTIGGHVSIPTRGRVRVEAVANVLPWLLEDRDDVAVVSQLQLRFPFRQGPPGSRRSLLVGATAFTIGNHLESIGEWEFDTGLRPHAGVSWQWQKSRHLDVRIDLQGVFIGTGAPFVAPFATFSMVWHRERGWS
jgi:hypothetical protein